MKKMLQILDRCEIIIDWQWVLEEEEAQRKDKKPFTKTIHRLNLYTTERLFTVWDNGGKQLGFPSFIKAFPPKVEAYLPRDGTARPVNVFWDVEGKGRLTATGAEEIANGGTYAYLLSRTLTPSEKARLLMPAKPNTAATHAADNKAKRAPVNRRNGKPVGRPVHNAEEVQKAVCNARALMTKGIGISRACELTVKHVNYSADIGKRQLQNHVNAAIKRSGKK